MTDINALSFCSLNCNGLLSNLKRRNVFSFFGMSEFSVFLIQETHLYSKETEQVWRFEWGGEAVFSYGSNRSRGVGILFKPSLSVTISSFLADFDGRVVVCDCVIFGSPFRIICVYAPDRETERRGFYKSLSSYLSTSLPIIMGGDFNCILNSNIDKVGGNPARSLGGGDLLRQLCTDSFLKDVYRSVFPSKIATSWSSGQVSCLLDRFFISDFLVSTLANVNISPSFCSDHCLVSFGLTEIPTYTRGPGYWHCNVSILSDPLLRTDVRDLLSIFADSSDFSHSWWEELKMECKEIIKSHSTRLARERREEVNSIRKAMSSLFNSDPQSSTVKLLRDKLDDLLSEYNKGVYIRSKVRDFNYDDRPSRYFFNKEKKRGKSKLIRNLTVNGDNITDFPKIMSSVVDFYSDLFSDQPVSDTYIEYFLKDLPSLSSAESESLEGPVTLGEVRSALRAMDDFSSPGSDGLPKEFYLSFFDDLGPLYVTYINKCFQESLLSPSQRLSYITLICKDTNKSDNLKFWRPISLLNIDYKILSKILCTRLSTVMSSIVHPDQSCSVPGRSIHSNCHVLRNIVDYVDQKHLDALLLNLDHEKAFDRVSHRYLKLILEHFKFGPTFRKWISVLYSGAKSSVIVNGFISKTFSLLRGVHQGCALSPLLYVLSLEPLLNKIRAEPQIKGIKVPGSEIEVKVSAFADDVTCPLSSKLSVVHVLNVCQLFENASGSKLNITKTSGLWLGGLSGCSDSPYGISWTSDPTRIVGLRLASKPLALLYDVNWRPIYDRINAVFNLWKGRNLSFRGRSILSNIIGFSKLWYLGSVIHLPNNYLSLFEHAQFSFFWNSDHECLKRATLYNCISQGGHSLVNISLKIKSFCVMHIVKLLTLYSSSDCPVWCHFAVYWLGHRLRSFSPYMARNSIPHSFTLPDYYQHAYTYFREFCHLAPDVDFLSLTTKKIYSIFLNSAAVPARIVSLYPNINFSDCFRNINSDILENNIKNFLFRCTHRILYTGQYLNKICRKNRQYKCLFCKAEWETLQHLFFLCPCISPLYTYLADLLKRLTGFPVRFTSSAVVFTFFRPCADKFFNELFIYLLSELKWSIWKYRNEMKYHKKIFSIDDIKSNFLRAVKRRIFIDFKRMPILAFLDRWSCDLRLCSVDNDKLCIFL